MKFVLNFTPIESDNCLMMSVRNKKSSDIPQYINDYKTMADFLGVSHDQIEMHDHPTKKDVVRISLAFDKNILFQYFNKDFEVLDHHKGLFTSYYPILPDKQRVGFLKVPSSMVKDYLKKNIDLKDRFMIDHYSDPSETIMTQTITTLDKNNIEYSYDTIMIADVKYKVLSLAEEALLMLSLVSQKPYKVKNFFS